MFVHLNFNKVKNFEVKRKEMNKSENNEYKYAMVQ